MHVRGPAGDGMQMPHPKETLVSNGRFDGASIGPGKHDWRATHPTACSLSQGSARSTDRAVAADPASGIAWEP